MASSIEVIPFNQSTTKLENLGSNSAYNDNNADIKNFYNYQYFPCVYINDVFNKSGSNSFYCTDVDSVETSYYNVYGHYDAWNEIYRGTPFNYDDNSEYEVGDDEYERIGRAIPTFVVPGTRPTFNKELLSLTTNGTSSFEVLITYSSDLLTIRYQTGVHTYQTKTFSKGDFWDNAIPKRLIVEMQGGGGGGSACDGWNTGNGGGGGAYWIGIIYPPNVAQYRIYVGGRGAGAEQSHGAIGTDGGSTELQYRTNVAYYTAIVRAKGGTVGPVATSSDIASGGTVVYPEGYQYSYFRTLGMASGGNGKSSTGSAGSVAEHYYRCTETVYTNDSPIALKRERHTGGSDVSGYGYGGGASQLGNGGSGKDTDDGGNGQIGAGGAGGDDHVGFATGGGEGGQGKVIIWY